MTNEVKFKLAMDGAVAVSSQLDSIEKKIGGLGATIGKIGHYGAALYAIPAALNATVGSVVRSADAITTLNTQLRLATGNAVQASKAYSALFDIAQQGRVSFTELGTTFASISRAGKEMGVSQERLLVVTKSISQAMTIGGGSAASMQAALVQLGQGLSSGVLRGEELNSIMEQTPRLAKAIADGMGVPIGKLRELGAAGQITGEQVIAALEKSGPQLAREMESAVLTVGQAFTMLTNSATKFAGDADAASGATATLAGAMKTLSGSINTVGGVIANNKEAFGAITSGLAGAATIAGVAALAANVGKLKVAFIGLNAVMAINPLVLAATVIGAGAAAIASINADWKKSAAGLHATIDGVNAGISRLEKRTASGADDAKGRAAAAINLQALKDKKAALTQELAILEASGVANESYNAKEERRLAERTGMQNAAAKDMAALDAFRNKQSGVPEAYLKDMRELIRLNQAGVLVGKEYTDALNLQQAALLKKTGATKADDAAAKESANAYKQAANSANDFIESLRDETQQIGLSADQVKMLGAARAAAKAPTAALRMEIMGQALALSLATTANEAATAAQKEAIKADIDAFKARDDLRKASEKQIETAATTLGQIEFETRLLSMNAEQRALATMERELERQGIVKGTQAYDDYIIKLREAMALKSAKEAGIKATDDLREAQKKAAEESGKYWEDALMRAFESGKGFFESLWDTIKNTLKTQILKVSVQGVMGSLGLGASGAAMAGGAGGGNLLSTASNLASLGTAIGAGVAGTVGSSIGAIFGTTAGNTALGMTLGLGSGSSLAAASAASVAGGGAAAGAGLTGAAGIAGSVMAAVPYVAAALAVAAAVGLFRKTKTVGQGISGTFGEDTELQNYTEKRKSGYLFGGPKYWKEFSDMDAAMSKQLTATFGSVKVAAVDSAKALGLSADGITSYQKEFTLALSGDDSKDQAAISALFTGMADDMARAAAPSIAEFAKEGETASVTLQRLSTSITTANAWLHLLQNRLYNVSLAGADAASELVDAFGGLDNLTASSKAYYEAYYTEAERTTRSSQAMAETLASVNVALPASKDAFRDVVSSLDLTSESGRNAYAVLLTLAPEYAATSEAIARLARESAAKLMATFTGNGLLVPALDITRLAIGDVTGASTVLAGELSFINSIMGDSTSAVIGFSNGAYVMGTNLSASQLLASLLNDQIVALQGNADKARIDFSGLSAALASVNTETFVTTLSLVFENLAERISGVIGDISTERIAVREAALQIINPTAMGKAQIQAGIAGINTGLPGGGAAQAASIAATQAAMAEAGTKTWLSQASGAKRLIDAAASGLAPAFEASSGALAEFEAATLNLANIAPTVTREAPGSFWDNRVYEEIANPTYSAAQQGVTAAKAAYDSASAEASRLEGVSMSTWDANKTAASQLEAATRAVSAATAVRTAADDAAKAATLAYASALQDFAIDAGKSVGKLTRLREETVKYYESQKALADLMSTSAAGLRSTVETYRYNQKTPEQQLAELQGKYSSAYITAMSVQGDGAALAGQGDKLNALLQPLIDKLNETGNSSLVSSYLAQAESVASLIEKSIPVNYQLDSLTMLGSIDATLAALDASSQSAEKIIAAAINAGSEKTADGLRAVIAALTGKTVPAFASGGDHLGGWRIVGETGPELEATGSSRIFNASQTRAMLGGGGNTARLEALFERQGQQLEAMSFELRAIAGSTNKTARSLDRAMPDGDALATRATV